MRIRLGVIAFAAFATTAATDTSTEACAVSQAVQRSITPDGATVAADGGVIIGVDFAFGGHPNALHLRTVGSTVAPTIHAIAPLLSVMQPAPGTSAELVDAQGKVVRTFAIDPAPFKPLAAPKLQVIASTGDRKALAKTPPTAIPNSALKFTLASAPPADAAILLIYAGTVKAPEPRGWITVVPGQTSYTITVGGKSCMATANYPVYQGESVHVAWLDRSGRVSASSAIVRVGVTK